MHTLEAMEPVASQPIVDHRATTAFMVSLIGRSFGLATGIALGILLASAIFAH